MKHLNITVKGKVQGVYFRQSTLEKAIRMGLNGFVKNLDNGDVYIEAEGDPDALNELAEWSKTGPLRARVSEVTVNEEVCKGFSGFRISG